MSKNLACQQDLEEIVWIPPVTVNISQRIWLASDYAWDFFGGREPRKFSKKRIFPRRPTIKEFPNWNVFEIKCYLEWSLQSRFYF